MLLVNTYIDQSPIHGIGLFAREPIAFGTVVCRFVDGFDKVFVELPRPFLFTGIFLRRYGYTDNRFWYLNTDNMRFVNHCAVPNLLSSFESPDDVAARDIEAGEELTVNYFWFDRTAETKLGTDQ